MVVWKYATDVEMLSSVLEFDMPSGARVIHVGSQHGNDVTLWALVDPKNDTIKKRYCVAGTGTPIDGKATHHLGSVLVYDGRLVFHVFEMSR